ncbi:NUDIX hydrolase [Corynebacterium lactis]|uniref:NUDIX hydrolase n=1 Tax=Corynebacterium lactis RW2-5 TaxID=1408189 RepID=A0A0K2GZW6_9CORY|nr:NUDIX hydrolase [Corynebacterium lactis]ALA67319.1 hypothetical protein CLAC_05855 [Corynebacterium lactis RW2-5]
MVTLPLWVIVLAVALFLALLLAVVASATATRLNRMHIRTDLARASLEAALGRRAAVARATFPELSPAVAKAEAAPVSARELNRRADAENELTREIVRLSERRPPERAFAIELADVHTRVELARRFYNDAVTDTKALRALPLVRVLRLAGTAPEPEYFEMSDVLATRSATESKG